MRVEIYDGDVKPAATQESSAVAKAVSETKRYLNEQEAIAGIVLEVQELLAELLGFDDDDDYKSTLKSGAENYYNRLDSLKAALSLLDCLKLSSGKDGLRDYDACDIRENLLQILVESEPYVEGTLFEMTLYHFLEDASTWSKNNLENLTDRKLSDSIYIQFQESMEIAIHRLILVNATADVLLSTLSELSNQQLVDGITSLNNEIIRISSESTSQVFNLARNLEIRTHILAKNQDYGDNVWRTITREDNKNWSTVFGKTKWRAQGRSGVIVAKDSPVNFRVKQGENDPKAMIKGQLVLARSVSDVALALAKLPVAKDSGAEGGEPSKDVPINQNTVEARRQYLREQGNLYLTELHIRLDDYLEELENGTADASLSTQLEETLQAYKIAFSSLVEVR